MTSKSILLTSTLIPIGLICVGAIQVLGQGLADPTAVVGLTSVAGSATTAMRSDAAPALDMSINPAWNGNHTFNKRITFNGFGDPAKGSIFRNSGDGIILAGIEGSSNDFAFYSPTGTWMIRKPRTGEFVEINAGKVINTLDVQGVQTNASDLVLTGNTAMIRADHWTHRLVLSGASAEVLGQGGSYIALHSNNFSPSQGEALVRSSTKIRLQHGHNEGEGMAYVDGLTVGSSGIVTIPSTLIVSKIGMGVAAPVERLEVAGTVKATDFVATNSIKIKNWTLEAPDYVFEKNYKMRSLKEVENHVRKHKHLPEIPSARDFKEKGFDILEMNYKLLQKIEELTLYSIEQEKRIEALESAILGK